MANVYYLTIFTLLLLVPVSLPQKPKKSQVTKKPSLAATVQYGLEALNKQCPLTAETCELISLAREGLCKYEPEPRIGSSCGVYYLKDASGNNVGVFKPDDEDYGAVNNANAGSKCDFVFRSGVRSGFGPSNEVAAYLLDHSGFSGVPPTVLVKCTHPSYMPFGKTGSLQKFIPNIGSAASEGHKSSVEELQKLAILDIRLANTDRHVDNILVVKRGENGEMSLIPIDHGFCLPESLKDTLFGWKVWDNVHEPFCSKSVEYVESLDAEKDIEKLKTHEIKISDKSCRILRVCTYILKRGVRMRLSPAAIAGLLASTKLHSIVDGSLEGNRLLLALDALLPMSHQYLFHGDH